MKTGAAVAVAGIDQNTLNALSGDYHKVGYPGSPGPFEGTVTIDNLGISTIDWALPEAPVFDFHPTTEERMNTARDVAARSVDPQTTELLTNHFSVSATLIALRAANMTLDVHTTSGKKTTVVGALTTILQARVTPANRIVFDAMHSKLTLKTPQPGLQWALDNIVVPQVQKELNTSYASGFAFRPFASTALILSYPRLAIDGLYLLAFACADPSSIPDPPPTGVAWPTGVFEMLEQETIDDVFKAYIKTKGLGKHGSTGFNIGVFAFKASYLLGMKDGKALGRISPSLARVQTTVGGGGKLEVTIAFVPVKIGLEIDASPVFLMVLDTSHDTLTMKLGKVEKLNVNITLLSPLPKLISGLLDTILNALLSPLKGMVTAILSLLHLPRFPTPTMSFAEGTVTATFSAAGWAIQQVSAGGKTFIGLNGTPTVSGKSS